jgi:hypothetical protein
MKVDSTTGDISFYEDTGTTPKFFWDASAESLGLGATSFAGETLRMERSADMIVGLFSGASNSTFLNMGTRTYAHRRQREPVGGDDEWHWSHCC